MEPERHLHQRSQPIPVQVTAARMGQLVGQDHPQGVVVIAGLRREQHGARDEDGAIYRGGPGERGDAAQPHGLAQPRGAGRLGSCGIGHCRLQDPPRPPQRQQEAANADRAAGDVGGGEV